MDNIIVTVVIAALGSSGLFAFITFLINRHDGKNERLNRLCSDIENIKEHLTELDSKNDMQDARTSRARILKFDDELVEGRIHSREYFLQILDDCETYEKWVKKNPDVKNGYAKQAVKHIQKTYDELLEKGEWKIE